MIGTRGFTEYVTQDMECTMFKVSTTINYYEDRRWRWEYRQAFQTDRYQTCTWTPYENEFDQQIILCVVGMSTLEELKVTIAIIMKTVDGDSIAAILQVI